MSQFTIYHNPRCSKSRNTLSLLKEKGVEPEIVLYLEAPLTAPELRELIAKLNIDAADLVRRGEAEYQEAGLGKESSEQDYIAAMAAHPRLIERPVVVCGSRAVLGRPPENVLDLLS
ncbi:MAG: arsenate reductase (glutaredoxin) [Halioglobus sp.]